MTTGLVVLGAGYSGARLALVEAASREVTAVTRDLERAAALRAKGVRVVSLDEAIGASGDADVVVSVPPEAELDGRIAQGLERVGPRRIVYLSSTAVYGGAKGRVDEDTPVAPGDPRGAPRLRAEAVYRRIGGVVLRVAGIYGPGRGVQARIAAGAWRIPGDGRGHVSRIHVDDLVEAIRVALQRAEPGAVLNVADDRAGTHLEVAEFLASKLDVPMPPFTPLDDVHPSLRGDREIDNSRLRGLGWAPRFPTFREGYEAILKASSSTA